MSGEERFLYLTLLLGAGAWQLQRQLRRQYCLYFSNVANVALKLWPLPLPLPHKLPSFGALRFS